MKEAIISYETAKMAKEIGYDIPSTKYYKAFSPLATKEDLTITLFEDGVLSNYNFRSSALVTAMTQTQYQRYLREHNNAFVSVGIYKGKYYWFIYRISPDKEYGNSRVDFDTFEEALERGLQEASKKDVQKWLQNDKDI